MIDVASTITEILFVIMILTHMFTTNKSISRLEERLMELDTEVFKTLEPEVAVQALRKKRVRKPKVIKDVA